MTSTVLGKDISEGNTVTLHKPDQRQGVYIVGTNGYGKSTLIENMVMEDIKNNVGVCVIDPNNDLIDAIISRLGYQVKELRYLIKNEGDERKKDKLKKRYNNLKRRLEEDVIFIDLASREYVAPFSLFYCENPDDPFDSENVVSAFMHIMSSMYDISDQHVRMNQYFINIANLLTYNPQHTLLDIKRVMTDDAFLDRLLVNVHDPDVIWFWRDFFQKYSKGTRRADDISMISNKLQEFTKPVMRPWFGDISSPTNFRAFMDQGKLVFIKLHAQWPSLNKLLGNIIIAQLLDAAYSRSDTPKDDRRQMNVYIDEVQDYASPDLGRLFTQSRKYGLALTMAHQVLQQLDPLVQATCRQAANIICFRLSGENAKAIASEYDCSPLPGPPRHEPLRTPVSNPIDFMVMNTKGVHPQEATRAFIDKYGKLLVDGAKREESIETDRRHEEQRYFHDLAAGARYKAEPLIQVSHTYRALLDQLNRLFYQAMLFGKEGKNPDDIPINEYLLKFLLPHLRIGSSYYEELWRKYKSTLGKEIEITELEKRVSELQDQLENMPLAIEEKARSLHIQEAEIKQQIYEVHKAYLLAQVKAARASMLFVERNKFFVTGKRESEGVASIYFPDLCSKEYLTKLHSEEYNRNALFIFQGDDRSRKPVDYDDIRRYWSVHTGLSYSFKTWEEAVSYYFHLFSDCWFHINPHTFFDKRYWRKTEREVYWKESNGHLRHTRYFKEKKERLFLNTWELLPGIENTWVTPEMIEYTINQAVRKIEAHDPRYSLSVDDFYNDHFFLQRLLFLETAELNPASNHYESVIINKANGSSYQWNEARKQRQMVPAQMTREMEQKRESIQQELQLISEIYKVKLEYEYALEDLRAEIRQVMRELAASPVEADNGMTHEVPGPEIPSTEVERRIANQIANLPGFTARARLKTGEYTINTIDPNKDEEGKAKIAKLRPDELQQCIEEIQKRNVAQGYLRLRSRIEKEIFDRQQPIINPPSKQAPQPKPQPIPQHVTSVTVANTPNVAEQDTESSLPAMKVSAQPSTTPIPTPRKRKKA